MKTEYCHINSIPAVLYGGAAERVCLFIHGRVGRKEEGESFAVLVYAVCGIAFLAAAEEFVCAVKMKEYDPKFKGFFRILN